MNYLAHLFLSGDDEDLRLGNFIADSVRGAQILQFPLQVQQGIKLHRLIDAFTDQHPVVAETKQRLRPKFRKYAGVVADVFYDHFLASHFPTYSPQPLAEFAHTAYTQVQARPELLPEKVRHFLPHMIRHNWLVSYAQVEGITRALQGLSSRATFASGMETAGEELLENYTFYQQEFHRFFPQLQAYAAQQILLIRN
ncbi:acyl carrier protein phosphodiesterase [Rufibacter psychrotolerans]|uniref:acyl carrier protein phosphodiesterase n=1 Tax=Rufibacter psychrotolerans TaxID=2812556 RepID=UPI001966E800|nr:ACP phosphodiesterase [Rufibacter sp. SYSU D00308]